MSAFDILAVVGVVIAASIILAVIDIKRREKEINISGNANYKR